MEQFSDADVMLLEKELTRLSYKQVAFLLDKTVEDVIAFVSEWLPGKDIVPYQAMLDEKASGRPQTVRKPREKKAKIISRQIEQEQRVRRNRMGEVMFKTKVVDYSKMKEVRIDHKTCIYIKPGEDPKKARDDYLTKLRKYKSRLLLLEN